MVEQVMQTERGPTRVLLKRASVFLQTRNSHLLNTT